MNQYNTIEKMKQMRMGTMAELYHQSLTEHFYRDMSADSLFGRQRMGIQTEQKHR